jgi:hypothetical protein
MAAATQQQQQQQRPAALSQQQPHEARQRPLCIVTIARPLSKGKLS